MSPKFQKLVNAYGFGWTAMHHYCWGLDMVNRAIANYKNEDVRKHYLGEGIENYDYVLDRTNSKFHFKPQILVDKGRALILLDRNIEGVKNFMKAIKIRPGYIPAYIELSNYFKRRGDVNNAILTLKHGIKYNPNSEILKRKLKELGK